MDKPNPAASTRRATKRPPGVVPPAHWQPSAPPEAEAVPYEGRGVGDRPDPVRYGDWEKKGIAIDF